MRIALLAVIPLGLTGPLVAQAYRVTEIGPFEGGYGIPIAISNAGQVVGYAWTGSADRAWSWQLGILTDLDPNPPSADRFSWALGVADGGTVLGWIGIDDVNRAALWGGGTLDLLPTPGGASAWARDVNDRGTIVGQSTASGANHASLWQADRFEDLGTLGGLSSFANAINSAGQIVGSADNADNQTRAFLWEDGRMIDLGTLGGSFGAAADINEHGLVVGNSSNADGAGRAFLWSAAGGMVDLGVLEPFPNTYASAINDLDWVVGNAYGCPQDCGILWRNGRMINLAEFLPTGVSIASVSSINDAGQIIAITFGNRAVLLTPADLGDLDRDGAVGIPDLLALLAGWGTDGAADLNHDGVTDRADQMLMLGNWG